MGQIGQTDEPQRRVRTQEQIFEEQIHLLQTTYEWITDDVLTRTSEPLLSLSRFYQLVRIAAQKQQEDELAKYELSAWQGWQFAIASGNFKEGFGKWREAIGLDIMADRILYPDEHEAAEALSKEEIMAQAEDIVQAAKSQGITSRARQRWEARQKRLKAVDSESTNDSTTNS